MKSQKEIQSRQIRAYEMLNSGEEPKELGDNRYLVHSQYSNGQYMVCSGGLWSCQCKDYEYRKQDCKHILAVRIWLLMKERMKQKETLNSQSSIFEKPVCAFCKSFNIMKHGKRKCENMTKQRYMCKDCGKTFIDDREFSKFKGTAKIITLVMDLYFNGLSLRKIRNHLKQFYDFNVHHETLRQWIIRFTSKIAEYVDKLQPNLSDTWHADEMVIKSKGKNVWVWNVLDESTRFLIANNITDGRDIRDARQVFRKAKNNVSSAPLEVITDGLPSYGKAIRREFKVSKQSGNPLQTKHVRYESIRADPHNNKIERFHGTMREKDKIMRGWKGNRNAQALLDGYRVWYNFVRPHQALNGLTPSQASGIDIPNNGNKWIGLIKTSHRSIPEKKPMKRITGYEIRIYDKDGKDITDSHKGKFKTRFQDRKAANEFLEFYRLMYQDMIFYIKILN